MSGSYLFSQEYQHADSTYLERIQNEDDLSCFDQRPDPYEHGDGMCYGCDRPMDRHNPPCCEHCWQCERCGCICGMEDQ